MAKKKTAKPALTKKQTAKGRAPSTQKPVAVKERVSSTKDEAVSQGKGVQGLFAKLVSFLSLCLILAVIGYGFYHLQRTLQSVEEKLSIQETGLEKLHKWNLPHLVATLKEELNGIKKENERLNERLNALEAELSRIDPHSIWKQRLQELVYLAAQKRRLRDDPYQILSLLNQAHSLAMAQPGSASLSLVQALIADIAAYKNIPISNKSNILAQLDDLMLEVSSLPHFPEVQFNRQEEREVNNETDYLTKLKDAFINLGSYVRIYKKEGEAARLLTEEEARLIEMSARVRIMQAQLAVLQDEEEFYYAVLSSLYETLKTSYPPHPLKTQIMEQLISLSQETIKDKPLPPLLSAAVLAY